MVKCYYCEKTILQGFIFYDELMHPICDDCEDVTGEDTTYRNYD